MTLSEELIWRGFVNQTTLSDPKELDKKVFSFYLGVDPSADSMQIGNLAMIMMIRHFINYGHKAFLLVGGATGMIGDPDGKEDERNLQSIDQINDNKKKIEAQYKLLFSNKDFSLVDNYSWFKDFKYLDFLRDIGKHVPMRQMLGRDFVANRLSEAGSGISYAEFSYVLIQAYDFYFLHKNHGVNMQISGSDQWGNCIAGVDLIRRMTGDSVDVWTAPLVVNPQTGIKFGKSESGAVWLDPAKTSPTNFYQFWINCDDNHIDNLLKVYTELSKDEIESIMLKQHTDPKSRIAQYALADNVTKLVHGDDLMEKAKTVTLFLTGQKKLSQATETELNWLSRDMKSISATLGSSVAQALVSSELASSNKIARQLIDEGAIYINNQKTSSETFSTNDFLNNYLLLRRGKTFKDSALIKLDK